MLKVLAWIIGILLGLAILTVIGLKLFFPLEKAKAMAIEKGSATLGREITIEDVDVSIWGGLGVKLGGVVVGNPEGFEGPNLLEAENIDVKLRLWSLIMGSYHVDRLIINRPTINMLKRPDGTNNYTFAKPDSGLPPEVAAQLPEETPAAALAVAFDRLEVNKATLLYVDDSSKTEFDLFGLNLATSLENPRAGFYSSKGELAVDSVRSRGLENLPTLSAKVDYEASYETAGQRLVLERADLKLAGIPLTVSGEITNLLTEARGRLGIKSDRIKLSQVLELLPPERAAMLEGYQISGDLAVDFDLEYDQASDAPVAYYGTAVLSSVDLSAAEIPGKVTIGRALIDFKNDNLRFNIEDGAFDGAPLKGHLLIDNFENPILNGEIAGKINLAYLKPFLPVENQHSVSGEAVFAVKVSGSGADYRQMGFTGDLTVTNGKYSSLLLPEPIDSFALDMYFDNRLTNIRKFTARTKSGIFEYSGRINDLVPYMMADSTDTAKIQPTTEGLFVGRLDLAILTPYLPPKGNPVLNGQFESKLEISGVLTDYTKLKPRGTVKIVNASYSDSLLAEPVERLDADLIIAPDTITVSKMNVKFVSSDVSFTGNLIKPFPYLLPSETIDRTNMRKPMFLFELSSKRFDVDRMFPEAVPGSGGDSITVADLDSVSAFILPDIDGRGAFRIDTLIYSGVEFSSLAGKIKIEDRKIECYEVTGKAYAGDVSGNTTIDLNDFSLPRYTGEFHAVEVEAGEFMKRFTKFGDHLFGKINLDGTYDATGWDASAFLRSLRMNSSTSMKSGRLVTSGSGFTAVSGLAEKVGQSFDKEQSLRKLSTMVEVRDGKVHMDQLKTKVGDIGDLDLDGFYSFDGEIAYNGTILLSEEMTKKLLSQNNVIKGLAGILNDKSIDRVKLPLVFSGTIDNPKFKVDYDAVAKNVTKDVTKEAGDLLNNLFKKK